MRFVSTGTPVASSSSRCDCDKRAGFTLIEALVAMALLLAFVAALGPYLFHARRIMDNAERRMKAQILLRMAVDATRSSTRSWTAYRIAVSVSFSTGQIVAAETIELAKSP
jgi:prepilin-type N-terminal cleavage/methylation domain-containing protein